MTGGDSPRTGDRAKSEYGTPNVSPSSSKRPASSIAVLRTIPSSALPASAASVVASAPSDRELAPASDSARVRSTRPGVTGLPSSRRTRPRTDPTRSSTTTRSPDRASSAETWRRACAWLGAVTTRTKCPLSLVSKENHPAASVSDTRPSSTRGASLRTPRCPWRSSALTTAPLTTLPSPSVTRPWTGMSCLAARACERATVSETTIDEPGDANAGLGGPAPSASVAAACPWSSKLGPRPPSTAHQSAIEATRTARHAPSLVCALTAMISSPGAPRADTERVGDERRGRSQAL